MADQPKSWGTSTPDGLFLESAAELERARDAVFSATLDRVFAHHPFYSSLFAERAIRRGDIGSVADIARLPVTYKSDYVAQPNAFALKLADDVDSAEQIVWDVMYTTGSTGNPTPFVTTTYDFLNVLALNQNMLRLRGVTVNDVILNLFPLTQYPHGAFARAMNAAAAYGIPIVAALPGAPSTRHPSLGSRMDDVCALAGRTGATILWGVPSYLRKMLGRTEELGITVPAVRLVFVTGEGFGEAARQDMVDRLVRLGAPMPTVSVSYGATEMQGGMVECVPGAGYHNPAPLQFMFEAVDPETHAPVPDGDEGLILLTHLDRRGTIMLRYALGDTARLTRERCPVCGALTERLISVPTRCDGFLKVKGMLLNPQAIVEVLAAEPGISDFQAFVEKEDRLDPLSMDVLRIRVALRGAPDSDLTSLLLDRIKTRTGVTPLIEIAAEAELSGGGWKAKPIIDLRH